MGDLFDCTSWCEALPDSGTCGNGKKNVCYTSMNEAMKKVPFSPTGPPGHVQAALSFSSAVELERRESGRRSDSISPKSEGGKAAWLREEGVRKAAWLRAISDYGEEDPVASAAHAMSESLGNEVIVDQTPSLIAAGEQGEGPPREVSTAESLHERPRSGQHTQGRSSGGKSRRSVSGAVEETAENSRGGYRKMRGRATGRSSVRSSSQSGYFVDEEDGPFDGQIDQLAGEL